MFIVRSVSEEVHLCIKWHKEKKERTLFYLKCNDLSVISK